MTITKTGTFEHLLKDVQNMLPQIIPKYSYINKQGETISTMFMNKGVVKLPRNKTKLKHLFPKIKIVDKTVSQPLTTPLVFKNFSLRDYQQKLLTEFLLKVKQGETDFMIEANTGFGKSFIVPFFIEALNQKTLILVDREFLLNQMVGEIETNTNHKVNIINSKTTELDDINICTLQMLNNNQHLFGLLNQQIGLIVQDEAHIVGAETIKTTIQNLNAKYRIGLSATPTRSDGLNEVLFDLFETKLVGVAPPKVSIVATLIKSNSMIQANDYRKLITKLMKDNEELLDLLIHYLIKQNHQLLVAVNDKKWQSYLAKKYKQYGTAVINSNTKKEDRQTILELYDKGKIKILFGFGVLEKGISIPEMSVLINFFSATTKEKIEQLLGRLNRESRTGKEKHYIDFIFPMMMWKQMEIKKGTLNKLKKKLKLKVKEVSSQFLLKNLM